MPLRPACGLPQPLCQRLALRQARQVIGHLHAAQSQLQQLDLLGAVARAQHHAHRRVLALLMLMPVQPAQVLLHLLLVLGREFAHLQLHRHQPPQLAVVEQQIEVEVLLIHMHVHLPRHQGEARARPQQEGLHLADDGGLQVALLPGIVQPQKVEDVGIAHEQRRRHALGAARRDRLLRDQRLGIAGQRQAFIELGVDAAAQRAGAPALDARHAGVVLALHGVLERNQHDEMRPAQFPGRRDDQGLVGKRGGELHHAPQVLLREAAAIVLDQMPGQHRQDLIAAACLPHLGCMAMDVLADVPVQQGEFTVDVGCHAKPSGLDQVPHIAQQGL